MIQELQKQFHKASEGFKAQLSFFNESKQFEELGYVQDRIRQALGHEEFKGFVESLYRTPLEEKARKLKMLLYLRKLSFSYAGKMLHWKAFCLLHSIVRELHSLTDELDPYVIRYRTVDNVSFKNNPKLIAQIHLLYKADKKVPIISKTAVRQDPDTHRLADIEQLREKLCSISVAGLAFRGEKLIGFSCVEPFVLEHNWINIGLVEEPVVDSNYDAYGVRDNLHIMMDRDMHNEQTVEHIDYLVYDETTYHPLVLHKLERMDYRLISIGIGSEEDVYGFREPGYGKADRINVMQYLNDFRGEVGSSADILFVNREDYWYLKLLYMLLGCKRRVVIITSKEYRQIDYKKLDPIYREIEQIHKDGSGAYYVDLTTREAPAISRFLQKNGFYLSGVLPMAKTVNKEKRDYAYFRYLDENRSAYPYMFLNYPGIGPRYKVIAGFLKLKAIEYFNSTRSKNKIPKIGLFYRLDKLPKPEHEAK